MRSVQTVHVILFYIKMEIIIIVFLLQNVLKNSLLSSYLYRGNSYGWPLDLVCTPVALASGGKTECKQCAWLDILRKSLLSELECHRCNWLMTLSTSAWITKPCSHCILSHLISYELSSTVHHNALALAARKLETQAVISTCRPTPAAHWIPRDLDLWYFDLRFNACRATAVPSLVLIAQVVFLFRARTHTQTRTQNHRCDRSP